MVGIGDVARRAGVSTATVSRALSGSTHVLASTRERVTEAASELGYVVSSNASSLASGRTKNVGAVVPQIDHWYFSSVLEGVEHALLERGYDLTLYSLSGNGDQRTKVFDDHLLRKRVDAVIAVSLELTEIEVGRLLAVGKPVVGVGGLLPGVRSLTKDDVAIARLATEHLLSLGHTRIAHIGASREFDRDFHIPSNRRLGYEEALTAHGLTADPTLFRAADFTIAGGFRAAKQILGRPDRPTAIFAASDEMAIGSILAARELGLIVPHDVSVAGIDDHELAEFFGLTTVPLFPYRQGTLAVDLLMQVLDGDLGASAELQTPESEPYELIVRSSTARPVEG